MNLAGFAKFCLSPRNVYRFYQMTVDGYLVESGWVASAQAKKPVDKDGSPTPWFTTNFVGFLGPRLRSEFNVLEFGAGNSTLFFAKAVKSVTSIEDNQEWHSRLTSMIQNDRVKLHFLTGEPYYKAARSFQQKYHIIVVDGSHRFECAANSVDSLAPSGVIILDNSLRPEYVPIYELLHAKGFRHIDFWGMAGGSRKHNCTTVFYRDANCLGI